MEVDGRACLLLAGANYLDLAGDARVVAAAQAAADEYGTAAAGSRLINGNLALHEELERARAARDRTRDQPHHCGSPAGRSAEQGAPARASSRAFPG
jgi:8-amino-7-oxononanoate synthase